MTSRAWSLLRDARYALPGRLGHLMPESDAAGAARHGQRLALQGKAITYGYFASEQSSPTINAAAYCRLAEMLDSGSSAYLSVKAPQLAFDPIALGEIAATGFDLVLDALAPDQADAALALAGRMGTGCVLPARWQRSQADARQLRDHPGRIRLVKGEWADPSDDTSNPAACYLALAAVLAGRCAPVAVATHDPALARAALSLLQAAGTPCELEQLHGLPQRRTRAVAKALGVKVRVYVPFGPGWWPYAIDQALRRPYLPKWWLEDLLGLSPAPVAA